MQLRLIRTPGEFEHLAGEWNDLLKQSAIHVPFLRHEYLTAWWQALGGGEWEHAELAVVTGRDMLGSLIGVAPLFYTQNRQTEPALMLLGSIEISDYLDLIARLDDLPAFIQGLFDFLGEADSPPWRVLDWYNILDSSPTLPALEAAAGKHGWRYSQQHIHHCPYIPLPGDWGAYLAGIDKKQRHEVRRKMRRAESSGLPMRWYIVGESDRLEEELNGLFRLMANDSQKAAFLTERMRCQMQALARAAFDHGWLQLAFLEIDSEKAAGYLNFDFADHIWVYNSGFDPKFNVYSPGWVLLGYLLKWANASGRQAFDFMRGDEDYKYRFGGIDRSVVRVRIER